MSDPQRVTVYTVPSHRSFADALAAGLIARFGKDPLGLARGRVLLPNNRAVRTLTEAFVRVSGGGLLLPRLIPVGDPELDERVGGARLAGLSGTGSRQISDHRPRELCHRRALVGARPLAPSAGRLRHAKIAGRQRLDRAHKRVARGAQATETVSVLLGALRTVHPTGECSLAQRTSCSSCSRLASRARIRTSVRIAE